MPPSNRARFTVDLAMIQKTIDILARDIDNLGELAIAITGGVVTDQLACYAANALQGPKALLREMEGLVAGAGKRKGRGQ
jgi:hypothetical protein